MQTLVRRCIGGLLFSLSLSLLACSDSQSPARGATPGSVSGPPAYEGYLDVANCGVVSAWGWDQARPNEPIKLDIYDGNLLVATVTADSFRKDLLGAGKGDGKHSTIWTVPPQMKDGKKHVITVRFGGTSLELGMTPVEITCTFS